jgi:hypothetical protein
VELLLSTSSDGATLVPRGPQGRRRRGVTYLSITVRHSLAIAMALVLAGELLAAPVAAAKLARCRVENAGTGRASATLQAAVDAASAGASLRVKGTCVGSTLITKDLTITGFANKGLGRPTLDGAHAGRVLTITAAAVVTLRGLFITNGSADYGGGIATIVDLRYPQSVVTVIDSVISGNTASEGGGIDNGQGVLTLVNSAVRDNAAVLGGGIHNSRDNGWLYLEGTSSVSGNYASGDAGGIYSDFHSSIWLYDTSSIHHNTADGDGGGMLVSDSQVELHDTSSIHHNTAGGDGGGVFILADLAAFTLYEASSVSDNSPDDIFDRFP